MRAYELGINSYSNVIIKYFIPLVEDSITEITLKIHSLKKYCFRASLKLGILNLKLHKFHSRLHQTDICFLLITYSPNRATISQWIYVELFCPLYAKILLLSTLFLSHFMVIAFFAVASYTHSLNIKGVLAVTRYNAHGPLPCIYNYLSVLISVDLCLSVSYFSDSLRILILSRYLPINICFFWSKKNVWLFLVMLIYLSV